MLDLSVIFSLSLKYRGNISPAIYWKLKHTIGMLTRSRGFATAALKVINDVAKQQFTVSVAGAEAVLKYCKSGNNITFVSTDVPEKCQGKGVGKLLAKCAFENAHSEKLNVVCQCHFLAKFYEDNCSKYEGLKIKFDLE